MSEQEKRLAKIRHDVAYTKAQLDGGNVAEYRTVNADCVRAIVGDFEFLLQALDHLARTQETVARRIALAPQCGWELSDGHGKVIVANYTSVPICVDITKQVQAMAPILPDDQPTAPEEPPWGSGAEGTTQAPPNVATQPPCLCLSPTFHEPECAWLAWWKAQ